MFIELAAAAALLCLVPAEMEAELRLTGHEFIHAKWLSPDLTLYQYVGPDGLTTIGEWPDKGWCLHQTSSKALKRALNGSDARAIAP